MNRNIITASVVVAVSMGLVVVVRESDLGERADDGRIHRRGESKLVELEDGGKGYAYPTTLEDGGTEYVVTSDAPCVRSMPDAGRCWRTGVDGGAVDFGALSRFAIEDMHPSSTHCQPVACSVVAGEDPDEDEGVKLERERRRRDAGR